MAWGGDLGLPPTNTSRQIWKAFFGGVGDGGVSALVESVQRRALAWSTTNLETFLGDVGLPGVTRVGALPLFERASPVWVTKAKYARSVKTQRVNLLKEIA